jgi:hypothetical protein
MSYEVLSFIVAVNAVVTFSLIRALWQMDATKGPTRLNKKFAKLLWHSDPIVPRHDPPKIDFSQREFQGVYAYRREFFLDFKEFADVMNSALAESYGNQVVPSRFRLQDRPEDDVGLIANTRDGPTPGRCFELFYNQYPVGRLAIEPWNEKYTTETPYVQTHVKIDSARYLRYWELTPFLHTIASLVSNFNRYNPNSDDTGVRLTIEAALTEALWGTYENSRGRDDWPEHEDRGQLLVRFRAKRNITYLAEPNGLGMPQRALTQASMIASVPSRQLTETETRAALAVCSAPASRAGRPDGANGLN